MEKLVELDIAKDNEYIYFVKADENGKLSVYRAKKGRPKKNEN